jgi:hypothetical protein
MYKLAEGVVLEDADGTSVFLMDGGDAAVLDPVGRAVVKGLLGGDVDSCTARITRDYDVSEERARRDISDFTKQLLDLGLIEDKQ